MSERLEASPPLRTCENPRSISFRSSELCSALARFPRLPLGTFPSPVRMVQLEANRRFWLKDDSGCSPVYGGNKVRKLEYLFAAARRAHIRTLVVPGDVGSHTVQAAGLLGRHAGFAVDAVVFPHRGQTFDDPEIALLQRASVRVFRRSSMLGALLQAHWLGWHQHAAVIPLGASSPVATLGHVAAALELVEQVRTGVLPEPQRLFLPFATGGSVAGLLIGFALAGVRTRVIAVRTVERIIARRSRLERLVRQTLTVLGFPTSLLPACLQRLELIDDAQLGRGFRDVPASVATAVTQAAAYGLALEPVFSGKAFAALLNALTAAEGGELLFWNTHDHRPTSIAATQPSPGHPSPPSKSSAAVPPP